MSKYQVIAATTFGLEAVVADEVKKLGFTNVTVENGKVMFPTDEAGICRANLWLRAADRIRIQVAQFKATSFEQLFEETKALPWGDWLPKDAEFPVEGKSVKSTLFSVSDCQAIVKKAIVESMKRKYKVSWFEENGPLFRIEVALLKDVATITLDSSGTGLHRRGYKPLVGEAPLRETMAAGLILLSRWQPDTALIDPFCGSGTIPIEAALIGMNIAPGINREFACEDWPWIPKEVWRDARREAHDLANYDQELFIIGSDINDQVLKVARQNAAEAFVDDKIHFQTLPLSSLSSKKKYGKIICNPPYGERIGERDEVAALYREMGRVFSKLDTWSFYILTSYPDFEKLFGKPATKKRKFYNGNIRVDYYQYYGPRPPKKK
ncbi:MAG: class I SAM-dependent RNA methyltransferase [Firmicutes bacterium]|nr:class I SAM-dependent RNA methyltransferase [Bacillota bacterium]